MAYWAAHRNGEEIIFKYRPTKDVEGGYWWDNGGGDSITLGKGVFKKLTGKDFTFDDEPIVI